MLPKEEHFPDARNIFRLLQNVYFISIEKGLRIGRKGVSIGKIEKCLKHYSKSYFIKNAYIIL